MEDLLGNTPPPVVVTTVALEGLVQQRVEGFAGPDGRGAVAADSESRHQGHLLEVVLGSRGAVQGVAVLVVLVQSLQEAQGFREVYWNGNLGEVLPDTILHDAPQAEGNVWLVRNPRPSLSADNLEKDQCNDDRFVYHGGKPSSQESRLNSSCRQNSFSWLFS